MYNNLLIYSIKSLLYIYFINCKQKIFKYTTYFIIYCLLNLIQQKMYVQRNLFSEFYRNFH